MTPPKIRILVLKHLAERPLSGYSLIREIHAHTGWKPSYGSVYPELERLRRDGLATFKKEGRSKLFTLTKKGEEAYRGLRNHHEELIGKIQESQRLMCHVCDVDEDPLVDIFVNARPGQLPLREVLKEGFELKAQLARLWSSGWDIHKSKVKAILKETNAKLGRLR